MIPHSTWDVRLRSGNPKRGNENGRCDAFHSNAPLDHIDHDRGERGRSRSVRERQKEKKKKKFGEQLKEKIEKEKKRLDETRGEKNLRREKRKILDETREGKNLEKDLRNGKNRDLKKEKNSMQLEEEKIWRTI